MGVMSRFLLKIARQAFSVLSLCGLGVQFKVGADGAAWPDGAVGQPADAILFLASDRSSHVNGDEITVDGGYVDMLMNPVPRPGFE